MAHWCLGQSYLEEKRYQEAILELERANTLGTTPLITGDLGCAYAVTGHVVKARAILEALKRKSHTAYIPPYLIAAIYGALDEKDKAFEWLERADDERDSHITYLLLDPRMDPLRSDPRFKELVRRVGLP